MFTKSTLFKNIWLDNQLGISFVYALNIIEEICYVLIPAAVGMLINTFLTGQGWGIAAFSAAYLGWQGIATMRKIYDTRIFTKVYNQIAMQTIEHHKAENIEIGKINARIELLKQVVGFFENDLPYLIGSVVMMFGSAGLLYFYNPQLLLVCLLVIVPSMCINYFFGKKMVAVTKLVNDKYEEQLETIETKQVPDIQLYMNEVRLLNIKKSNLEAYNFGLLELFVFVMIMVSIYVICKTPNINYGDIVATYGYILRFAYSFDFIPHLTERLASMNDIQDRLEDVF